MVSVSTSSKNVKTRFAVFSIKKYILPATFVLFVIGLVTFSSSNLAAAKSGLKLWANNVVPSLFPFFISGYPMGAKIVTDLRTNNNCTKDEGERMLCFTNNSGPLFIIGTVRNFYVF